MPTFYLLFGNTPELSLAEVKAVVKVAVEPVTHHIARVQLADEATAKSLQETLGGTVKIYLEHQLLPRTTSPEGLLPYIAEIISKSQHRQFSLAEFNRDHLPPLAEQDVKNELKKSGVMTRYRQDSRQGLSAAVLIHETNLIEVGIINVADQIAVTELVATQNIDDWTIRDRHKPYADRKKGMLPPKVARMMVNLGIGTLDVPLDQVSLYDPFCGTGTVLMEAAALGCKTLVGSDNDAVAIQGTQLNLDWYTQAQNWSGQSRATVSDVTKMVWPAELPKPNVIVTEPFLGKPKPQLTQLDGIFKGLEKLYWGAFRHWVHLMANPTIIVMVLPTVQTPKRTYTLASLIDKMASLGYTMVSEPILYHRPQAIVQRQIHVFRWQQPNSKE
jgi:tRNA G10  N-methylase Trm11